MSAPIREYVVTANGREKVVTTQHRRARKVFLRCVAAGMRDVGLTQRARATATAAQS